MLAKLKSKIEPLFIKKRGPSFDSEVRLKSSQEDTTEAAFLKKNSILRRQILMLSAVVLGVVLVITLVINVVSALKSRPSKKLASKREASVNREEIKIEVASKALDPEKMWRNHFEDKLIENEGKVREKLILIDESLKQKEQEIENKNRADLEVMRQQLEFAKNELRDAVEELKLAREQQMMARDNVGAREEELETLGNITSRLLDEGSVIARPKSSRRFIPETGYVSGVLLGGISVSTGALSSSEPTPVIIRVTSRGNLPKNFEVDLKTCRILGSSYGDLSSERAIIRAEVMSCSDQISEQVITTKIAGMAFGDDGVNGIKGRVVQTSSKQLQHAFMGGILSGFAGAAKGGEQFTLTGAGAVNTKQSPFQERLKDSTMGGLGSAGEKIADYYLKQAENMSPVLQIPAGSRVDVVFTKGVYLGSGDVRQSIEQDRRVRSQQGAETRGSTKTATSSKGSSNNAAGGDDRW